MNASTTFKTLLLREWMQHRLGWLLLGGVPLVIMLPLMLFGTIQLGEDGPALSPAMVALVIGAGYAYFAMVLVGLAVAFQAPGLARRDIQDRSIEFWLSLPTSHTQSVAATVLMHMVLLPLLVLAMAGVGAVLAGLIAAVRLHGPSGLLEMSWQSYGLTVLAALAHLALGVVLGVLWLSPLLMAGMAASAWLKRWGVPALVGVLGIGGLVLDKAYGNPVVFELVGGVFERFAAAVGIRDNEINAYSSLADVRGLIWEGSLQSLSEAASLPFLAGLLVAAAGFALVVYRRTRP